MPMNWTIEGTLFHQEHKGKESELGRVFNSMCYAICNWLYDRKIGGYSDRQTIEQCSSIAILTEQDSEDFISEFPEIFTSYEKYKVEMKEMMTNILREVVGMKVWAN